LSFAVIVDRHVRGDSFVHRLDPRAKLVTTLAFIFSAVLIPQGAWAVFGAHACLLAMAVVLSALSPRLVVGRSLLALPFVLAAVPVLFNRPGVALFEVPLTGWTATDAGLEALTSILLRSWLSVTAATILTATTEPDQVLRSLRWLGVPRLLVATISFMWRYVFVIAEEAQRMLRARDARSARTGGRAGGSLAWRAGVAGNMVGTLFLRSLNRSERVYTAMLARGYNGELRSLERFNLRARDVAVAASAATALAVIQLYARI
jgi:cobalt/nickel transport system permease protein